MIEILKAPEHKAKRTFHCLCGCDFQADTNDYKIDYNFLTGVTKYIIKCPWCKAERMFTDKDSAYTFLNEVKLPDKKEEIKKVYCYIDKHFGEVIAISADRTVIEEMMVDDFIEAYNNEMQNAVDEHYIDVENPGKDSIIFAQETWDSIMSWFLDIFTLQEVEIV